MKDWVLPPLNLPLPVVFGLGVGEKLKGSGVVEVLGVGVNNVGASSLINGSDSF